MPGVGGWDIDERMSPTKLPGAESSVGVSKVIARAKRSTPPPGRPRMRRRRGMYIQHRLSTRRFESSIAIDMHLTVASRII